MDARRKRDIRLCGLALGIAALFALLHIIAPDVTWVRRIEVAAFDAQLRWRGSRQPGPETVIVMIDDQAVADVGQWPIPRERFAELLGRLRHAGARVIGIDVLFADRGQARSAGADGDALLAREIRDAGNVVLPFTFDFGPSSAVAANPAVGRAAYAKLQHMPNYRPLSLEPSAVVAPLATLAENAALGHMLVAFDVDGAPRYEYPALAYDLDHYPSMAVRVAQLYLGVPWSDVSLQLGKGISLGRVFVPTDAQMRMLVNYLGPPRAFPTWSLSQVLRGEVADSAFRDRIVLVGANVIGTQDTFKSPFTAVMPGVERLATVVDALLHGHDLRRPQHAAWVEIAAIFGATLLLALTVSRLPLATGAFVALALAAAYILSAQVALARFGVWQATAVPVAALIVTFLTLSIYRYALLDRERRHIRNAFRRYLSPPMVDRLVADADLPQLGGETRELTILFCDLQGFTSLSERLEPTVLTRVVNQFLSAATDAVLEYGGTVDKYVGDCIMAFWNAPVAQPNHAELACRAALRIVENLEALNAQWQHEGGLPRLRAGVGINTGPCTVGNFGSTHRLDYSAIGDAVNVAARLESETREQGFTILVGPETAARVPDFATLPLGPVRVRGRAHALDAHALIGDESSRAGTSFRELRAEHMNARFGARDGGGAEARVAGSRSGR